CDECLVQVAYAIGVAKPVGLYVNTYGTARVALSDGEIARRIGAMKEFDMRPYFIEQRFQLRTPIYAETAAYGHMGRQPRTVTKVFNNAGQSTKAKVRLFPWEDLNALPAVKKAFGL
ncbi:MAG: methionine adenosyltransferase domain-containing protein, partial [Flavobacteriales bacterium]|nr:methionine adenosyltransferase domain-containing protein [Flavobacteriales bacterium]